MGTAVVSRRTLYMQWLPVGLFIVGLIINYFDRVTLSIGNPQIRQELGLNVAEMGILLSAFSWAYAFAQLPSGILVDKIGPRRMLGSALFLWSLAQAAAGFVFSLGPFIAARMALGVFEAPTAPSQARIVADWFERAKRGLPMGISNTGSSFGNVIGPPVLTLIMLGWGWRAMFVTMAVVGGIFGSIWFLLYRDPEQADIPAEELAVIRAEETRHSKVVTLRQWCYLFRFRTTWGMIVGNSGSSYLIWLYLSWMPGYLEIQRHVSLLRAGFYTSVPQIFGVVGAVVGGVICDRLFSRGFSLVNSRRIPLIGALIGTASFTMAVAFSDTTWMAIAFILGAVFCSNVTSTSAWALVTAVAPASYIASIGSMQNCGGFLGASLAPIVTGFIVLASGSFAPAFVVGSIIAVLAALCYTFLVTVPINEGDLERMAMAQTPTA
jgi:sugar phosphate permease